MKLQRKILVYGNGKRVFFDEALAITPNIEPLEEIDLDGATMDELKDLKKNPNDKKLADKIKNRKK